MIILAATAGLIAGPALAQSVPVPRPKPEPAPFTQTLPPQEFNRLAAAFEASRDGDWGAVRAAIPSINDPVARKLLLWRIATSDEQTSFRDLANHIEQLDGWPNTNAMKRDAEYALSDKNSAYIPPSEIAAYFSENPPITGEGHAIYAFALFDLNLPDDAELELKKAWRGQTLKLETQRRILNEHAQRLSADDHWSRVDFLLWADQRTAARDVIPYLSAEKKAVAQARLGLTEGTLSAANVPSSMAGDPGILHQRARAARRRGDDTGAIANLRAITENPSVETGRGELWNMRHLMAREALELKDYRAAYDLTKATDLEDAGDRSEAEFLAGWVALRFLDMPEAAGEHFKIITEIVSTPVSLSRGQYWQGRAAQAAGDTEAAQTYYTQAAEHITTYYGLLAAERLESLTGEPAMIVIPADPEITQADIDAFESRELVQAARMLGELGEDWWFTVFAYHIEDTMQDAAQFALLSDMAKNYGMMRPALRVAKSARNRHIPVMERAYPLAFTPPEGPQYVEPALALAISRQETEFDPRAVSHANAHGLMQLLPTTAQSTARSLGRPYRYSWLLDDPDYNAELGSSHLKQLVGDFNGSYIVSMAGYNAGASRGRRWIATYGDPRAGAIDPVDWVELVPFGETRNYIQRVIENLQVYRARQNGNTAPVTITEDLNKGSIPKASLSPT